MAKMRAVQVSKAKGPLELVERDIPQPGKNQVLLKVKACGICHSDSLTIEDGFPGVRYPRIPGHEVAGVVETLGEDVKGWKVGDFVGVGWVGGYCGYCDPCRRGNFTICKNMQISGVNYDGGYAEYMVAPASGLALIPKDLSPADAGPLMCAGVTTFNSLRNSGTRPGDRVAVIGVGGLGHLAIQFAHKMGFNTIAIARGKDKEELARKLGAVAYIDSEAENPGRALAKLGGAKLIVSTVTNSKAMEVTLGGLAPDGKLLLLGVSAEPIQVPPVALITNRLSLQGWPSGSSIDSQDTMNFCSLTGIKSMNQTFPLEKAREAYEFMMSGKARFRAVLVME